MTSSCPSASAYPAPRRKPRSACPRELSLYTLLRPGGAGRTRELLRLLSERAPVHWDPYVSAWLVCGREQVATALSDARFAAGRAVSPHSSAQTDDRIDMNELATRMLLFADGTRHMHVKKAVQTVLSARRITKLEPWMRALAARLLPDGHHRLDFAEVAQRFPLLVLARLLGIAEDRLPLVLDGSAAVTEIISGPAPTTDSRVHRRAAELYEFALGLVHERRARPGDDGTSAFVAAADADGGFDDPDIAANLVMLLASGHQTMPGFLGFAMLDRLGRAGPARSVAAALTDITPSRFVGRVVTAPVELGGCLLEPGDSVVVLLAAANWARPDPEAPARHFAFGHGRHRCAGAAMAELEASVMLDRFEEVCPRPAGEPGFTTAVNLPGLSTLPIEIGGEDRR